MTQKKQPGENKERKKIKNEDDCIDRREALKRIGRYSAIVVAALTTGMFKTGCGSNPSAPAWSDAYSDWGNSYTDWNDSYSDWNDSYSDWNDSYSDWSDWSNTYSDWSNWDNTYSDWSNWSDAYGDWNHFWGNWMQSW